MEPVLHLKVQTDQERSKWLISYLKITVAKVMLYNRIKVKYSILELPSAFVTPSGSTHSQIHAWDTGKYAIIRKITKEQ